MTIRSMKRLIATKSQRLRKYLSEEIYNLETGEYYSSRFQQDAIHIGLLLRQRWKLLAFATALLGVLTVGPPVAAVYRRRLSTIEWTSINDKITIDGKTITTEKCQASIRGSEFVEATTADESWTVELVKANNIYVGVATEKGMAAEGALGYHSKAWAYNNYLPYGEILNDSERVKTPEGLYKMVSGDRVTAKLYKGRLSFTWYTKKYKSETSTKNVSLFCEKCNKALKKGKKKPNCKNAKNGECPVTVSQPCIKTTPDGYDLVGSLKASYGKSVKIFGETGYKNGIPNKVALVVSLSKGEAKKVDCETCLKLIEAPWGETGAETLPQCACMS